MFPFLVDINMIQTKKMQSGDKTPTLYSFYDDQYDFNNLARRVDSGMNEHISTLKRGKKYEKEFREAVANIMSGIKDGTVTFGNGRFNDSLGRYSNAKDKDKDVYGWAASYVYNNMWNIPKYVKQDTSKKYDNTILGKALTRTIFGTDNGNIQYFWDVDPLDQSTNTRGIDQRLGVIGEAIQQMNLDNLLDDYSDSDRAIARQNLQEASRILQDGIQPGETLKLSRIFGGIDWNNWLKTDFTHRQDNQSQDPKQRFFEYISTQHPLYEGELTSQTLNQNTSNGEKELFDQLLTFNKDQLLQVDINQLSDSLKESYLNLLISQGLAPLSQSEGVYIVPNSQQGESVLTYNPQNRRLERKRTHELSYYRKQWINDYNKQYGTSQDQLAQYFTEFKKNGGILRAQRGVKFSDNANWYTGVFQANLDHILQGLQKDSNYYKWLNDMQGKHASLYKSAGNNWQNTAYNDEAVGVYQNLYKTGYNNEWGDNKVGYNSLGIQNAQNLGMFDTSGSPRTSGDWNGDGKNWTTDNLYSAITDYRRLLGRKGDYDVHQLYQLSNQLRNRGYDIYLDNDNYYKLRPISTSLEEDIQSLKGIPLHTPQQHGQQEDIEGSRVYPVGTQSKTDNEFVGNRFGDFMLGITPDLIGTGRLFASLRTNNRVARTLDRSLRPILKDTYERYSPITGAFGEMSFRNRQAADLRRQASRPFTSDASLQLAGQLEADRQARDLEYQGFLADDKEIKRTQEAALARQEDNMARRSEVSNFNRASINQTNREKAQLEATRLRHNWQSVDNFLQGVEGRLRTSLAERRAIRQNASMQAAQTRYQEFLQRFNEDYKRRHPNATQETMLNDPEYIRTVQDLRRRYQYDTYNIGLGRYYRDPYAGIYDKDNIPTYESILYSKNGGRLRPSIMTMINKVIKNESYT